MSESWSQRMAAAVKKWGATGPGLNGRYEAARLTDLSAYGYIKKVEKVGRMLSIPSPFFRPNDGRDGSKALIQGKKYINFAWCNYLGPERAPLGHRGGEGRRSTATARASRQAAWSPARSRCIGTLEEEIAEFCGTEDALLFVSGHAANVSTIGTHHERRRSRRARRVRAQQRRRRHPAFGRRQPQLPPQQSRPVREDPARVTAATTRTCLIIIEGLYSTEGDVPDLARLVEIKERYGAWLMVDDAHGVGVLGERGSGLAEHCGVDPSKIDILMGTLSKTLASCGGYIAGARR